MMSFCISGKAIGSHSPFTKNGARVKNASCVSSRSCNWANLTRESQSSTVKPTSRNGAPRQRHVVQSLLVPDISADPGVPAAAVEAARRAALQMPLYEVAARAALEIFIAILIARTIMHYFSKLGDRAERVIQAEKSKQKGYQNVARIIADAGIEAAQKPVKLLVPLVALLQCLHTVSLTLQILIENELFFEGIIRPALKKAAVAAFHVLSMADRFTSDFSQLGIIVFTLWVLLKWKQRLVDIVVELERKEKEAGGQGYGLDRIVLPLSSLGGWAMIAVGVLTGLHIIGVNIQPLLAVGGIGGIAIGFGAQAVTANAISGINLFLTRPFVVGDRVELKTTGGGSVLVGVVERIDPMRTILRTDSTVPVAVPNKVITEMIVSNESRIGRSNVQADFKDPRCYSTTFKIKYSDFDKVGGIVSDVYAMLKSHTGVDHNLPVTAQLQQLGDSSVTVAVTAHTTPAQSRDFAGFNHGILLNVADILQNRGVKFS